MDIIINYSQIHPNVILIFGVFLLFGVIGGILAAKIKWIPTITAFMLLGFIIGPNCLHLITKEVLAESSILTDIAIGLILYKLGNMLHPKEMLHSKRLLIISLAETSLTFICVSGFMILMNFDTPIAIILGAIAVSSSPAVLVHVSEELRASGPVTEHAKSLVALNNLISFIIFSLVLPFSLARQNVEITTILFVPLYRMCGAIMVGIALSWIASKTNQLLNESNQHYRFAIIVSAVMLTLGICKMLEMSVLLSPLILGIAIRWFETEKHNLSNIGLGEGGDLFYIILFVMAGAKIDPALLIHTGIIPVIIVIIRSISKLSGVQLMSVGSDFSKVQVIATGLLLLPMAGMAIGLVTTTNNLVPEIGTGVTTIVFAMVIMFETIGPFAAASAFRLCKEAYR